MGERGRPSDLDSTLREAGKKQSAEAAATNFARNPWDKNLLDAFTEANAYAGYQSEGANTPPFTASALRGLNAEVLKSLGNATPEQKIAASQNMTEFIKKFPISDQVYTPQGIGWAYSFNQIKDTPGSDLNPDEVAKIVGPTYVPEQHHNYSGPKEGVNEYLKNRVNADVPKEIAEKIGKATGGNYTLLNGTYGYQGSFVDPGKYDTVNVGGVVTKNPYAGRPTGYFQLHETDFDKVYDWNKVAYDRRFGLLTTPDNFDTGKYGYSRREKDTKGFPIFATLLMTAATAGMAPALGAAMGSTVAGGVAAGALGGAASAGVTGGDVGKGALLGGVSGGLGAAATPLVGNITNAVSPYVGSTLAPYVGRGLVGAGKGLLMSGISGRKQSGGSILTNLLLSSLKKPRA